MKGLTAWNIYIYLHLQAFMGFVRFIWSFRSVKVLLCVQVFTKTQRNMLYQTVSSKLMRILNIDLCLLSPH